MQNNWTHPALTAVDIILKKYNTQNRDKDALRFEAETLKELAYDRDTSLGLIIKDRVEQIAQVYRLLGLTNKPLKMADLLYDQQASTRLYLTPEEQSWLAAHKKIVVGGSKDWAPLDFVDETGNYAGIANEYLKIIGEKLGIAVEVITGPSWNKLLFMMRNKEIDILPDLYYDKQRESFVHFITPYLQLSEFIFAPSDNETISSFSDLQDKTIVVLKSDTVEDHLRSHYPNYDVITAPTIQGALKKVVTGQAEVFIGELISTSYNIRKLSLVGLKLVMPVPGRSGKIHMAVRKDWPILRDMIDKVFKAIPKHELEAINNRWISFAATRLSLKRIC